MSLIGGIIILLNGLLIVAASAWLSDVWSFIPADVAGEIPGGALEAAQTTLAILAAVGIISGIIVTVGGIMLYSRPSQKTPWGVIIIVLSVISLAVGGGFFIGMILGIIGGALGLAWKPR